MADIYLHAPIEEAFRTRVMFTRRRCSALMHRSAHVSNSSKHNAAIAARAFILSAFLTTYLRKCLVYIDRDYRYVYVYVYRER